MENETVLTLADVQKLGYDSVEELTKALQDANKSGADAEKIDKLEKALASAIGSFNTEVAALRAEKSADTEDEKLETLTVDKALELFKGLKDDDPNKLALYDSLSKEYGQDNVELAISGSELRKSLERIPSKKNPNYEDIKAVQDAHDKVWLYTALSGGVEKKLGGEDKVKVDWGLYKECAKQLGEEGLDGVPMLVKGINEALDTATATEGAEWLPTMMSGSMADEVYLSLRIAALFPRLTMTSKTWDLPIRTARSRGYKVAEATANTDFLTNLFTAHSMETDKITFTAVKLGVLNFVSDELEQDAILPVLSMINEDVIWGLATAIEDATMNGSTLTNDLDNAAVSKLWTSTADARNAWNGIRKAASSHTSTFVDGGTFATQNIIDCRKAMGKYGVDNGNLNIVTGPVGFAKLLGLTEVLTMDKFGPQATVKNGQLANIMGIPIIVSEYIYENLNASAVYDNVTTTKTMLMMVHDRAFAFGDRRAVRVETDRSILAQQRAVVSSWRGDFKKTFQSTEKTENVIRNVA